MEPKFQADPPAVAHVPLAIWDNQYQNCVKLSGNIGYLRRFET